MSTGVDSVRASRKQGRIVNFSELLGGGVKGRSVRVGDAVERGGSLSFKP